MSFSTRIKDAREVAQKPRVSAGGLSWYGKHVVHRFSIYISYGLAKLRIPANLVTVMSGVSGLCGEIGSTYAYKLKDRAMGLLRAGIGKPAGRPCGEVERLRKKVADFFPNAFRILFQSQEYDVFLESRVSTSSRIFRPK